MCRFNSTRNNSLKPAEGELFTHAKRPPSSGGLSFYLILHVFPLCWFTFVKCFCRPAELYDTVSRGISEETLMYLPGDPIIFDLPVTLTFYSVASGLSLSLCLVLLLFARFLPGTLVIRSWALAVLVISIGFFVFGIGPMLPGWATVIGANVALLSSGSIIYSGFSAFFENRTATVDRRGWAMVALTVPAFWYWGLIEPNGNYRSMVFSLAAAAINSRTALLFGRNAVQRASAIPTRIMAVLFAVLTVWMTARFGVLLFSAPSPPALRGANPTNWVTVFGHIVLLSLMSVCVMWMEANRLKERHVEVVRHTGTLSGFIEHFRNKLLLLCSAVTVLIVSVIGAFSIGYVNIRDVEKTRLTRSADLVNDAFVEYTLQVAGQIDTILRSVRGFYLRTQSITETETFINALGFDRSVVDNIYLIAADGRIVLSHDPATLGRSVTDRNYFNFHRVTATDQIFISPVEPGRVTGKFHFRITRRIDNPDGSFGGLVLATVNPESFARYYSDLTVGAKSFASLLGISDRKLRARVPTPPSEQWTIPLDSPLWEMVRKAPSGHYENTSQIDSIHRLYAYKKVGTLPLVMVTGFSDEDLQRSVRERMSLLVITLMGALAFTLLLALLLSIEAKRRDEHRRAETALRESELRLREAQHIGKIGDWEIDLNTGIVNYSDQIYEMSGRTPATMPLTFSGILLATHPDDAAELERTFFEGIANATQARMDARHILPDGSVKWFRYTGQPVCDGDGKVVKVSGTTQDIDRDKMLELELKTLNENLQQSVDKETKRRLANERLLIQRSKQADMGEMIGAIAHQWRQPLATVGVIFQNLLSARKMNKLDEVYLEKASTDATALISYMSKTIDSFRNFFRPEKTKEPFNVIEQIEDAAGFISGQLKAHGITVELPENTGPDFTLTGFPNEFTQVILNLLANGRDAILEKRRKENDTAGAITITAQSDGHRVIIEITDTGSGISPDAATRLFEPYFTTKEEGQGTGIGLYMSRLIIEESMGGKLTFTSKPGETVFRIELPNV